GCRWHQRWPTVCSHRLRDRVEDAVHWHCSFVDDYAHRVARRLLPAQDSLRWLDWVASGATGNPAIRVYSIRNENGTDREARRWLCNDFAVEDHGESHCGTDCRITGRGWRNVIGPACPRDDPSTLTKPRPALRSARVAGSSLRVGHAGRNLTSGSSRTPA